MARLVFIGRMLPGPSADLGSRQVLVCSSRRTDGGAVPVVR